MASPLLQVPEFLEELKLKRLKVAELESELTRLHVLLIEKDSELHCKTVHSASLEAKSQRAQHEAGRALAELQRRLKTSQDENNRLVLALASQQEKCRRVAMEKEISELKITGLDNLVHECQKQNQSLAQALKDIQSRQDKLVQSVDECIKKQTETSELCHSTELSVARRQREAEQCFQMAQDMKSQNVAIEKKLCHANARILLLEKGISDQSSPNFKKEMEALTLQLNMSHERETQLRVDLRLEREEKQKLENRMEHILQSLARPLHSDGLVGASETSDQPTS